MVSLLASNPAVKFNVGALLQGQIPVPDTNVQMIQTSVVAASGALLTWDFLCTLDVEINYAWSKPWSMSFLIFFLNRYPPFVDTFLSLRLKLVQNTPESCHTGFRAVTWFIVFGIILAEVILMLRTYAMWGCKRWVKITFIVLSFVTFVPSIVLTEIELDSLIYIQVPYAGCQLIHSSPIIIVAYILLVLCETIIAVLLGIKAFQFLPHASSNWVSSLYKDGLVFYVCLLLISIGNVVTPIINPHFANMLASPQRVAHSIVCNRILFLIFRNRGGHGPSTFASTFDGDLTTQISFAEHTYPPRTRRQLSSSSSGGSEVITSNRLHPVEGDGEQIELRPVGASGD